MKSYFWLLLFIGCSGSSTSPEPKSFNFEIKHWGTISSYNMSSSHLPWNGLPGIKVGYLVLNKDDVDLKIEYSLQIRGARLKNNTQTLIPILDAPFLSSTPGLISADITFNYDPVGIIENSIIVSGEKAFGISFALVDWGEWFSIWSTVTITATESNLSKGIYRMWEITTKPVEVLFKMNLAEGLISELNRNRELLKDYKEIGVSGQFGALGISMDIKNAEKSQALNDVVFMLRSYEALKNNN